MRWFTALMLLGSGVHVFAQPQYEVVDLTKMFGEDFSARDINNNGVVLGSMRLNFSQSQACVVENGKLTMLPRYQGKHTWTALAINDNGDVLGSGNLGTGSPRSVLYRGGKVIDIGIPGTLEGPGAQALSGSGKITGWMDGTPFIWDSGNVTVIPGGGFATAINGDDLVVGFRAEGGSAHAAVWTNSVYFNINPPWAWQSRSASVNDHGDIVGESWLLSGGQRGFLRSSGASVQLQSFFGGGSSRAFDINDSRQVVGWGANAQGITEGILWEGGTPYRLTDTVGQHPGFQWLEAARVVNNQSQILTRAAGGQQSGHHLLLNPVPEPGTLIALAVGLMVMTFVRFSRMCRRRDSLT